MSRLLIFEAITAGCFGPDPPASLLREGRAMRDALLEDFARVPHVEPFVSDHAGLDTALSQSDAALVVAPESSGLLCDLNERVARAGVRSLGCTLDAIRLASDKLALFRAWREQGVATPMTIAGPLVVKPRDGAGSQDVSLFSDDFVVQPRVSGLAASVSFLHGVPLLAGRQVLDDRLGYQGGEMPLAPELSRRAIDVATKALGVSTGWGGFVGVDVVLGETDWAIEINPRLCTSYLGLRQLARCNLAEVWWTGDTTAIAWMAGTIAFTP